MYAVTIVAYSYAIKCMYARLYVSMYVLWNLFHLDINYLNTIPDCSVMYFGSKCMCY